MTSVVVNMIISDVPKTFFSFFYVRGENVADRLVEPKQARKTVTDQSENIKGIWNMQK